ncbi:MAG TPA: NAD-dependent epimerase/dehydratase family protein [Anaerolineae bacterium]|nr:NAD-dependent epimerase/dehydratase family protein [Anaerolineae bacterium]
MSEKVLVTGATGFLGSYIVDSYVKRGIPVRAMARKTSNLNWLQPHLDAGKAELFIGSMTDHNSLRRAVQGVSRIVHAAAVIGPDIPLRVYQEVNVEGTRALLDAAVAEGVERFTLISSVSVYGYGYTPGGIVTEETPQLPSNPYGASKLAQQKLVFEAYRRRGLPVTAIEPPVIYGPRARVGIGEAFSLVKKRLAPLLDYGRGRMNLVYVSDVVGLLEAADASDAAIGERFLAAGPRFAPHREILELVAQSLDIRPIYFPVPLIVTKIALTGNNAFLKLRGKDIFLKPDYFYKWSKGADYRMDKAKNLLGWQPQVDIKEGIPKTVAWFVESKIV